MTATTSRESGGHAPAGVAEGVRGTLAAYCHALDDGRVADLVALFTTDGSSALPGMDPVAGQDALRALYGELTPKAPQRHLVFNTAITRWDGQRVHALSDLVFLTLAESGWAVSLVGRYDDVLREEDGQWRFERRVLSFVTP